jgi:hypothetical protein
LHRGCRGVRDLRRRRLLLLELLLEFLLLKFLLFFFLVLIDRNLKVGMRRGALAQKGHVTFNERKRKGHVHPRELHLAPQVQVATGKRQVPHST